MLDEERLHTTKLYLNKLACGINPLDGTEVEEDSFLNSLQLSRAFTFAADVLDRVMDNNCEITYGRKGRRYPFHITDEERSRIEISEKPVGIAVIAKRAAAVLPPGMKTVSNTSMTTWLESVGLLSAEITDGKKIKVATKEGNMIGIETRKLTSRHGVDYLKNFYSAEAQALIVSNLETIARLSGG